MLSSRKNKTKVKKISIINFNYKNTTRFLKILLVKLAF